MLYSSKGVDKPTTELAMGSGRPSPDPGLGTAVELTGGEVSGGLNLRMIRETLAGEGIPPEEAPPAFDEVQPAGAGGNGVLMDTGMGGEPLPDGTTGVAGQVVVDEVEVTDRIRSIDGLQELEEAGRVAGGRGEGERLPITGTQGTVDPDLVWSTPVVQRRLDPVSIR